MKIFEIKFADALFKYLKAVISGRKTLVVLWYVPKGSLKEFFI